MRGTALRVFVIILGVYVVGSMIAVHVFFSAVRFGRTFSSGTATSFTDENYPGYERIPVEFKSGKNRLLGYIYGNGNSKALIVISHGLGGRAESHLEEIIWFVDHGYRVFSYDGTGTNASEGKGTRGMAQSVLDLYAALSHIEREDELSALPLLLYGHSWGAYAAASVPANLPEGLKERVAAVVSISGYNSPNGICREHAKKAIGPIAVIEYPFIALENFFLFGKASAVSAAHSINAASVPVLIIHGTKDKMIDFNGASIIAQKNRIVNPKAEYYIRDKEGQNGHNDLFCAASGELDEEFMNRINLFYEKYLP
jgi:pimeloyl-ACP methyl ester carboxylesterase